MSADNKNLPASSPKLDNLKSRPLKFDFSFLNENSEKTPSIKTVGPFQFGTSPTKPSLRSSTFSQPSCAPSESSTPSVPAVQPAVQRHPTYYTEDGNVVLQAEDTLFKVHRSIFRTHSSLFYDKWKSLFEYEGLTDHNPVSLVDTKAVDFERLLWIIYPPVLGEYKANAAEEWISILETAHKWKFDAIFNIAVKHLAQSAVDPVQKVRLWKKYGFDNEELRSSYLSLVMRSNPMTLEESHELGIDVVYKLYTAEKRLGDVKSPSSPQLGDSDMGILVERAEVIVQEIFYSN